uniref:Zinc finger protein 510 n=2 Tax=Bactrocera dorsalis TaxID=27457 RepID=A0A034VWZ6_BACDO
MEFIPNMCRVCLRVEGSVPLINWNQSVHVEDLNESLLYSECFQQCTQLNLNYENSGNEQSMSIYEHFCSSCADKLKDAYLFITKAREADKTLRMNYWKSDSDNNKFFEWVGVGKEYTKVDLKKREEEDQISLGSNTFFDENTNSQGCVQNVHEENFHESEVLNSSKSILSSISKHIHSKENRRKKNMTKSGIEQMNDVVCGISKKSMIQTQLLRHSCSRRVESFLCKSCPRTFRHRSTLTQHELIHENNRERKFDCAVCGRKFYTQMARRNHLKTHDPSRKPRFHCSDCGQSFLFKGNLLVHQQKHAGQTIQCTYCQKRYVRAVDLEVHLRSHTGDTPFKCDMCEKAFTKRSTLQKHLQLHEGIQWKCEDCGKQYLYEWTLQRHRLEHTGLPLKCSICGKEFPEMYKIRRHIKCVHKINLSELENFVVRLKDKKKHENLSLNSLDVKREAKVI